MPAISLSLSGHSFEEAMEKLSHVYGEFGARNNVTSDAFDWAVYFSGLDKTMLFSAAYSHPWRMWPKTETPDRLLLLRSTQGGVDVNMGRKIVRVGTGAIMVAQNTGADLFDLWGERIESDALYLDWSLVKRIASTAYDTPVDRPLDLFPSIDLNTDAGRMIESVLVAITNGLKGDAVLLQSPLALARLEEAVVELMLKHVPHAYVGVQQRRAHQIAPFQVKNAIAYMHRNIERALTIQEVALFVGVSTRSLELGFQTFKGVSPAAYLRSLRFRLAHAQLADPECVLPIKAICLKWGIFHFGRFSRDYAEIYGELPSETRRRALAQRHDGLCP